jgi:hypothetical protein
MALHVRCDNFIEVSKSCRMVAEYRDAMFRDCTMDDGAARVVMPGRDDSPTGSPQRGGASRGHEAKGL